MWHGTVTRKLNWITWYLHYTPGSANNLVIELKQEVVYVLVVSHIIKETYGPPSGHGLQNWALN